MSDDYIVPKLSNDELRKKARLLRRYFGVDKSARVDILACLAKGSILTVRGEEKLTFLEFPDDEMGLDDGRTEYVRGGVIIKAKASVAREALFGSGRPRMTLAHELIHGALHHGAPMSRRTLGNVRPSYIRPFESAEHQARYGGACFLVEEQLNPGDTPDEIAITCGVSTEAAKFYLEERQPRAIPFEIEAKIQAIREVDKPPVQHVRFLTDPCTACGRQTLFPVGSKYMCQSCDTHFDAYQDGDKSD